MKTNKSYNKRLKVSKNGKIKARKPGQNHFNARNSRNKQIQKKSLADFVISNRDKRRFIQSV